MRCHDCAAKGRSDVGSPVPHFCDACGFALSKSGAPIGRTPSACLAVSIAEAGERLSSSGRFDFGDFQLSGYGEGPSWSKQGATKAQDEALLQTLALLGLPRLLNEPARQVNLAKEEG